MRAGSPNSFLQNTAYVLAGLVVAVLGFAALEPQLKSAPPEFTKSSVCPADRLWTKKADELCVDVVQGEVEIVRKDGTMLVIKSETVTDQ